MNCRHPRVSSIAFGLAFAFVATFADTSHADPDPNDPGGTTCYGLTRAYWCQSGVKWVNCYNHTAYYVGNAWNAWNYPPYGPSNALMLYTDGVDNDNHDIDYYEGNYGTNWYGGYAHWYTYSATATGCMSRGSGWVQINNAWAMQWGTADSGWNAYITRHETGHMIGLSHSANCGVVMNSTFCGGNTFVSSCDGYGAMVDYP